LAMLSYDIRSLESKAAQVDGTLSADDAVWEEGDPRPVDGVRVIGRLSAAGSGRYYFSGRFEGIVQQECRRCLIESTAEVADEMQALFAEPGEDDIEDDPDVYLLDARSPNVDLRPALREHWLLAVPGYVLCREDCKGLCPTCGTDWNEASCACEPEISNEQWSALNALKHHGADPS
jgi:uncharacterized protein